GRTPLCGGRQTGGSPHARSGIVARRVRAGPDQGSLFAGPEAPQGIHVKKTAKEVTVFGFQPPPGGFFFFTQPCPLLRTDDRPPSVGGALPARWEPLSHRCPSPWGSGCGTGSRSAD